jgi:hypothetical protein
VSSHGTSSAVLAYRADSAISSRSKLALRELSSQFAQLGEQSRHLLRRANVIRPRSSFTDCGKSVLYGIYFENYLDYS